MLLYDINIPPRARIFFRSWTWNFMQRKSKERSVQTCVLDYQVGHWVNPRGPTHGVCGQRWNTHQLMNDQEMVVIHWIQETNVSLTQLNNNDHQQSKYKVL